MGRIPLEQRRTSADLLRTRTCWQPQKASWTILSGVPQALGSVETMRWRLSRQPCWLSGVLRTGLNNIQLSSARSSPKVSAAVLLDGNDFGATEMEVDIASLRSSGR